jgi:hypothetical protein
MRVPGGGPGCACREVAKSARSRWWLRKRACRKVTLGCARVPEGGVGVPEGGVGVPEGGVGVPEGGWVCVCARRWGGVPEGVWVCARRWGGMGVRPTTHHVEKILSLAEQHPCKDDDKVGAVPDLVRLLLRRHDKELGSRVLDLELTDHRGGVVGDEELVEVVDDHLVHPVGAKRRLDHVGNVLHRRRGRRKGRKVR